MAATEAAREVEVFDPPPRRRAFSPTDVLRLLVGIVLAVGGAFLAEGAQATIRGIEQDLLSVFARLPDRFEQLVLDVAQFATSIVPAITLVVLLVTRRFRVAGLLLLAAIVAGLAMRLADAVVIDRDLAEFLDALRASNEQLANDAAYPDSTVIASTTAVVMVAAPWLSRRWKRALWGAVGTLVLLRLIAVAHPAFDLVLALGVGTIVGALILLLFGSPANEPGPDELLAALRGGRYDPVRLERLAPQGTALQYGFAEADGTAYTITLRTPDERDADLLARFYRSLRYRASEVGARYATLKRRIEHEALILTLAERGGVRAPRVGRIGETQRGSAFYVSPALGARPAATEDLSSPGFLEDLWAQVRRLHDAGVAHRHLALESIRVDGDGRAWLVDFDGSQTAPGEREQARDVAELLTETALVVGPEVAVAAAVAAMGPERVAPAVRMLQPLALPTATRRRAKKAGRLLDELRTEVGRATGAPALQLEELERIKPRTLLVIGASTLAFYTLLPQLANLEDTIDAFGDARPLWLLGTLAASALTYVFATISFQGAVAEPIPFAPTLRAQTASSFAGLVGPAGAGGFALTARFLERLGVGGAEAGASVAVNAIGGFLVHLALMAGFIFWAGSSGIGDFSLPDTQILLLIVTIVLALAGVLVAIGPVRRKVFVPVWATLRSGAGQIGRVFHSPLRVAALFGGSAGISLAYVAAVACSVQAFGGGLSLAEIGAGYLAAVALATLAPTPGGLGALESAMIAAFTGFGLGEGVAVSATLAFRLSTFWLPILPGWLAFGWMQRNDEL
jgi:glycosyltransferase 2 family protein